jgi:hypothetical protein
MLPAAVAARWRGDAQLYLRKLGPSFFLPPDNETISIVSVSGE